MGEEEAWRASPGAGSWLLCQLGPPATQLTPLSSVLILKVLGFSSSCPGGVAGDGLHLLLGFGRLSMPHVTGSSCIKTILPAAACLTKTPQIGAAELPKASRGFPWPQLPPPEFSLSSQPPFVPSLRGCLLSILWCLQEFGALPLEGVMLVAANPHGGLETCSPCAGGGFVLEASGSVR